MKFRVIDKQTSKEADPYEIALHEEWASCLVYCDMEGFAITEDGHLVLMDECGHVVYCDTERFKVVFEEERPHGEWTSNGDDLEAICSVCGEALPYSDEYDYETNFCPNCGADMRKEGEAE